AVFTGLGETFTASVPVAVVRGPEDDPEDGPGDDPVEGPETVPEPAPAEDAAVAVFRAAGVPPLAEACGGAVFALPSEPGLACAPSVVAPAAGEPVPAAAVPAAPFSAFSGLEGTPGRRSARISTARAAPVWSGSACLSSIFVTTSTSSSLLRLAAGRTRMLRKRSLPGVTLVTRPTSRPLGKMPSPPLVRTS